MNSKKAFVFDIVFLLLSLAFAIGLKFVFTSCDPMENGEYMSCHWAWIAVLSVAVVLTVQSVSRFFFKNSRSKMGISASMLPLAVLAVVLPKNLINLCIMNTMRCNATMKPFAFIMGLSIALFSIADIIVHTIDIKKNNLR